MEYVGDRHVYRTELDGETALIVARHEAEAAGFASMLFGEEDFLYVTAYWQVPDAEIVVYYDDEAEAVSDAERIGAVVETIPDGPPLLRIRAQAWEWALLDGGTVLTCTVQ